MVMSFEGYQEALGNFVDFSVGHFVTISDGNPNLGSNPTAIITDIDLKTICEYPINKK